LAAIYLEDLLAADDFSQACDRLSREAREAHGFPRLYQLGLVVPDVERGAEELEGRGIGPFFIADGRPVYWREQGQNRDRTLKLGLAYHQGIQVELLEPGTGSDFYTNSLDPNGKPVVHHLGFLVNDVDASADKLKAAGRDLCVRGQLKAIGLTGDFAYMDKSDDGLFLELIRVKLFGIPMNLSAPMVHSIGWIQKRTGKRCLTV
jgi:hypothetical protein